MSEDAMAYLERVKEKAIEMYETSDQGAWKDLDPVLQRMWINTARQELDEGP